MRNICLFTILLSQIFICNVWAKSLFDQNNKINPTSLSASLKDFLDHKSNKHFEAKFNESRKIKFKRTPKLFTGIIRSAQNRGISLEYIKPTSRIIIFDDQGLVIKSDNKTKIVNLGENTQSIAIFKQLIHLDIDLLESSFDFYFEKTPNDWTLGLLPKSKSVSNQFKELVVRGNEQYLKEIKIVHSSLNIRNIIIDTKSVKFNLDENSLDRYFR